MGQEVTARTHYRAKLRKRLMPVELDGPLPPRGTPILDGDNNSAGELCSGHGDRALAMVKLDHIKPPLATLPLFAGRTLVRVKRPDWMKL